MTLKKVIKELYSIKDENIKDSPHFDILEKLKPYSSPVEWNENVLSIPSIPGGRAWVTENSQINHPYNILSVDAKFHYLEGSDEEDLQFIRNIFLKKGLTLQTCVSF